MPWLSPPIITAVRLWVSKGRSIRYSRSSVSTGTQSGKEKAQDWPVCMHAVLALSFRRVAKHFILWDDVCLLRIYAAVDTPGQGACHVEQSGDLVWLTPKEGQGHNTPVTGWLT